MNTRNVKFLAVLAVLAMAFASFAIINPQMEEDDADAVNYLQEITLTEELTAASTGEITTATSYLVEAGTDYTLTSITTDSSTATIYIEDGASITLEGKASATTTYTIKAVAEGATITSYKVLGDNSAFNDTYLTFMLASAIDSVKITADFGMAGTAATEGNAGTSSSFKIEGTIGASTTGSMTASTVTNLGTNGTLGTFEPSSGNLKVIHSVSITNLTYGAVFYDGTDDTYYPVGATDLAITLDGATETLGVCNAAGAVTYSVTGDTYVASTASFSLVSDTAITFATSTVVDEKYYLAISGGDEDAIGSISPTSGTVYATLTSAKGVVIDGYSNTVPYDEASIIYTTADDLKITAGSDVQNIYVMGAISPVSISLVGSDTAYQHILVRVYNWTGSMSVTVNNTAVSGYSSSAAYTATVSGILAYGFGFAIDSTTTATTGALITGTGTEADGIFCIQSNMNLYSGNIYADSALVIDENITLTAGTSLAVNGDLVINGTLDATGITITGTNGAIEVGVGATFEYAEIDSDTITVESSAADDPEATPIWGPWTTNLEIDKTFYLSDNLIIEDGANFVVKSGGLIILNGYQITLNGNLEIRTGGAISGIGFDQYSLTPEGIALGKTGVLTNSGVIGLGGAAVTISHDGEKYGGYVSMQNVTGVEMAYGKYSTEFATMAGIENILDTDTYTYFLAIGGEANKFTGTGSTSTYKLVLGDNTILSSIEVSTGVSLVSATNGNIIAKNSIIEMNGDMSGKFYMESQSAIDMTSGGVKAANTVDLYGYTGAFKTGTAAAQSGLDITGIELKNASGISVVLSKNSYSESSTAYVDYRFEIAGKLAQTSTTKSTVDLVSVTREVESENTEDSNYRLFAGIYVEDALTIDASMNSASLYAIKGDANSRITVTGTISSTTPGMMSFQNANKFYTEFAIKESSTKTVYYQTSFETALDVIDDTVDGIKVYGTFDVPVSFIQESKKGIVLDSTAVITIPSTISVTIAKGSSMTGAVYSVEGRLTKIDGADMTTPINYTVMTKNDNNDITYSGLQPAIDDAKAGDVIVLKADASASSLTIPEGVTLDSNNYAITVTKGDLIVNGKLVAEDLTVKGKLIVNGEMESDGTVAITGITTVSGTADLTAAAPTFSDKVTSTGALIVADGMATTNFNGALVSDGTDMVLTTLPGAIAIALVAEENAITVYGTYSDSETIILPDGMVLTIASGAKATLGTIEISDATVVATGALTATLTGFAGTDAEETSMEFVEAKFTAVSDLSALNTSGANEYKFVLNTLSAGSAEILEGTVTSSATNTVEEDQTFTVASGAVYKATGGELGGTKGTVVVAGYLNVTDNFALQSAESTIAGDVNVAKGKTFTIKGTSSVTGTIIVLGTLDIDGTVTVLGSIDATADDAFVDMDGKLNIGESAFASSAGASVTGNIDLEAGKFIQVFPGSTFSSDDLVYTVYTVNGVVYKTVYAVSGTVKLSATISEKEIAVTGYDMTGFGNITNWKDSEGNNMTDVNVGKVSAIYFDGTALKVTVLPSVGVGMTLYIDGVSYTSGSQKAFSIGTHQVKVTINPGYKGSFDITFNGKPVAGETITLTADMTSEEYVVLTVTGQIEVDPGYTPEPVQEQDNTVTLILLVVLVVLVAAMAIITAMKLTRS